MAKTLEKYRLTHEKSEKTKHSESFPISLGFLRPVSFFAYYFEAVRVTF